jgi:hypothetical protein
MLPTLPTTHSQLVFPELHQALEPYRPLLKASVKPAWRLRCHQVDTISRTATHIGGFTPYVPIDMGWPHCPVCGNVLCFIWQINFAEFEAATFAPQGLFQFFYCWACFPLPGYTPYEFERLCRWYPDFSRNEAEGVPQTPCPYLDELSADQRELGRPYRVAIIPFLSAPSAISSDNPVPEELQGKPLNTEGETFYKLYNKTAGLYLRECVSQVSGYPNWVQDNDETPHCPACGGRAELVGAVGSDDTNLIWGDTGYWYLFACKLTDRCPGLNRPLMASQSL